jgi:hypothetical protein
LLRQNGDVALISYKLRKTVKHSLSVARLLGEAPSWLMSIQRDFSGARGRSKGETFYSRFPPKKPPAARRKHSLVVPAFRRDPVAWMERSEIRDRSIRRADIPGLRFAPSGLHGDKKSRIIDPALAC